MLIQTCTHYHLDSGSYVCDQFDLVEGVILPASAQSNIDLLMQGGFDQEAAVLGFTGVVSLWAIGFTVGIIISVIRKTRV